MMNWLRNFWSREMLIAELQAEIKSLQLQLGIARAEAQELRAKLIQTAYPDR